MAEKQSKQGWRVATPSANMDCFKICYTRGQLALFFNFPPFVPHIPIINKQ